MGQIFVLDRRTGQPITKVIEKPVPTTGHAEGENYPQLSHILWVCHKLVMTLYVKRYVGYFNF